MWLIERRRLACDASGIEEQQQVVRVMVSALPIGTLLRPVVCLLLVLVYTLTHLTVGTALLLTPTWVHFVLAAKLLTSDAVAV